MEVSVCDELGWWNMDSKARVDRPARWIEVVRGSVAPRVFDCEARGGPVMGLVRRMCYGLFLVAGACVFLVSPFLIVSALVYWPHIAWPIFGGALILGLAYVVGGIEDRW